MTRTYFRTTIRDQAGRAVANATVDVFLQGTLTPVSDMFAVASGGSPITTLLSSSDEGEIEAWFDRSRMVSLRITNDSDLAYPIPAPAERYGPFTLTETASVGDATSLAYVREGPLPASRYGALGDDPTLDVRAELQNWLNDLANVPNSQGRLDGRFYRVASPGLVVPGLRGLDLSGLGVIGQDSTVINDGAGSVLLPDANVPCLTFKANLTSGSLTPYSQKFHDFAVRYASPSGTGNTSQIAFLFKDVSQSAPSWFHDTFERLTVHNSFKAWTTAGNAGQSPNMWGCHWRDVIAYGTQRNVWSLVPPAAAGQPISTWEGVAVINTNTTVTADGTVFDFGAVEALILGADIEGWVNCIGDFGGGYNSMIKGLHVEHHTVDAVTTNRYKLLTCANGILSVEDASFSGTSGGGAFGITALFDASNGVIRADDIRVAFSPVTGSLQACYGSGGSYVIGSLQTTAGTVTCTETSTDAATALRVTGFDGLTSSRRLGSSKEYHGNGVPGGGLGSNGDWYKRLDGGGAGATHLYFKTGGSWLGVA